MLVRHAILDQGKERLEERERVVLRFFANSLLVRRVWRRGRSMRGYDGVVFEVWRG